MGQYLEVLRDKHIIRITLNRAEKHNAFNAEFIQEITNAFQEASADKTARVVFLSANGPSFCAGADLAWMKKSKNLSQDQNIQDAEKLFDMFEAVRTCRLPVVAKVHGNVFGGGLGLVAACDIAAADRSAIFSFSEVKIGLVPAVISSFILNKANHRVAAEYMISGESFEGDRALQMGLINDFEPELQVNKYLGRKLELFAKLGPDAVSQTKLLINQLSKNEITDVKKHCAELIANKRTGDEAQEGLSAFFEKRTANWVIENESKD